MNFRKMIAIVVLCMACAAMISTKPAQASFPGLPAGYTVISSFINNDGSQTTTIVAPDGEVLVVTVSSGGYLIS
jgi:hypothetical protein